MLLYSLGAWLSIGIGYSLKRGAFMEFFAGANTKNGFVSIFNNVFSDVKRLYILKGSSGCGKSTFMRRVAGRAHKLGLETHLIYCSSDVESLDGIIVPQLSIAVADGTSPHTMDTVYPCVRENIINLGQFWQEEKLLPRREEIIAFTDKKALCYKKAYGALRTYGESLEVKRSLIAKCTDKSALERYAFKLLESISAERGAKRVIFASAFTSNGVKSLPSFGNVKDLIHINGRCAEQLMVALERIVTEKGISSIIAYSPLDSAVAEGIYFPENSVLISSSKNKLWESADNVKTISASRFAESGCLQSSRVRINGTDKLCSELLNNAMEELKGAREAHKRIEEIYIPAMNFSLLDEFTFQFIEKIFPS